MSIPFVDLQVGDQAIISDFNVAETPQGHRLMMLGITPGTIIKVNRVAPLGDPIEIQLRGFNLSLRREEAAGVWVELNE